MTSFHERLAAAATPGPWRYDGQWMSVSAPSGLILSTWAGNGHPNAAFIAACPPEMVQAWENVVKAAREVNRYDLATRRRHTTARACRALVEALAVYDAQVAALQEEK
jgi:hypothetical protein